MLRRHLSLILCAAFAAIAGMAQAADISGAGATFPAPVYAKWAEMYRAQTGNRLNYQAIGSGGGIRQITNDTVDFGASDRPLKPDELTSGMLTMFPTVVGGIAPVVNLPGIGPNQLKLTGPLLADIYRGAIRKWNDPLIARFNPGLQLPNLPITVVHRSDGSGTTFLFTTYLTSKAPRWEAEVGASDSVRWPTGIGGKGSDGVAAYVKQTVGSIGYVEYAFAKQNNLTTTMMLNAANKYVAPSAATFGAAAQGAKWSQAPGFYLLLLDQPGPDAWPITGATFILVHTRQDDAVKGRDVLAFWDWCYKNGDSAAAQLDYVPLPAAVKDLVRRSWTKITGPDGKPLAR